MAIDPGIVAEAILREGRENISEATLRIRVERILANYFAFWSALSHPSSKTEMLCQEWKHLFGQVSGYKPEQLPEIIEMEQQYRIDAGHDMPRLLFTVHTYYALIIKLLAAEILTLVRQGIGYSFIDHISMLSPDKLKQSLAEMEVSYLKRGKSARAFSRSTIPRASSSNPL